MPSVPMRAPSPRAASPQTFTVFADATQPPWWPGCIDRFPNLRLVFAHVDAGWAFHWLEFMDITYVRHRHLEFYARKIRTRCPASMCASTSGSPSIRTCTTGTGRSSAPHRPPWASHFGRGLPDNRQQAVRVTSEVAEDVSARAAR